jgi:hypothetical protein
VERSPNIPRLQGEFIERAVSVLAADPRIVGVAAAGSYADNQMDEFSDVDLVVAVASEPFPSVLTDRHRLVASIGPLLAAFTGEHVGEPGILICLYGPPALHVDFKFIDADTPYRRTENPLILWEREGALTNALRNSEPVPYSAPAPQWIEDRFWVWIQNIAARIGRGELLEAYESLSFLRLSALAPLGLVQRGMRPMGVRRLETLAPDLARELEGTVADLNAPSLLRALAACVEVYRRLRDAEGSPLQRHHEAEAVALAYLGDMGRKPT